MANNIVSEWLEDEVRHDYIDGTNFEQAMKARVYAAKLHRLFEAAKAVRDSDHCECKGCVELFNSLDDAIEELRR